MNQPLSTQAPLPHRLTAAPRNMALTAIGRDNDVIEIYNQLTQSAVPLVITGVGGLGKTTVVQLFWQKYENQFDHVAYLTADAFFSDSEARADDNAELFLNAFANNERLTSALHITFSPEHTTLARFLKVLDALERIEGNNLLVIDNVSVAASRYFDHLSELVDWRILFTSRDALRNMKPYRLGTLSTKDAVVLFSRIYEQRVEEDALTNILRGIHHHTLAIELIAAYAREKNSTIAELEDEINKRGLRQLGKHKVTSTRDSKSKSVVEHLVRTFLMEFDESEAEIMRYFSALPADGTGLDESLMTEDQLAIYFQKEDNKADLHNTLSTLVRLNWLKKQNNAYLCHPIVKEMAYIQLKPNAVNCEKLIEAFNDLLDVDQYSNDHILNYKHFEPLAAEILRGCYDEYKKPKKTDKTLATLADRLRNLHWQNTNYYTALKYGEINLILTESIYGSNHLELAPSYSNLAIIYLNLGNLPKAKDRMKKAIAIEEAQLDPQHLSFATSYSNLALIYQDLGDLPKAKAEMEKAITIEEAQLHPQYLRLATSYSNLALIYQDLGDLPRAKTEMEKAITIEEAQLDPQHLRLATSYSNLATIYRDLGDLPRAKMEMEKAIAILEDKLDPQHLNLATGYSNLATIYQDIGDLPRAKAEMEKAITIKEAQLDPQHLNLATSYSNLALIYRDLGDLPRAKTEMEKAITIEEAQLDPQHLRLATRYNNLAHVLADMQALPLAKTYMDKAVTIWQLRLPPEHPNLLASLKTQQAWAEILRG